MQKDTDGGVTASEVFFKPAFLCWELVVISLLTSIEQQQKILSNKIDDLKDTQRSQE